jgi:hypothetical protein
VSDVAADDVIGRSLRGLADDLEQRLGAAAVVERDDLLAGAVHVRPVRSGAQAVGWFDLGEELQVHTGVRGRWELDRTAEDVAFIRDVCEAVIAGRGHEVRALQRSRVVLRLADGRTERTTGSEGCLLAFVPLPFWTRWGQRVDFRPYEPDIQATI